MDSNDVITISIILVGIALAMLLLRKRGVERKFEKRLRDRDPNDSDGTLGR